MSIKLGSNIASLVAQRRLADTSSSLSSVYERLSSGQRINRASDDAAGLAIANELNSKSRVFTQAIRNGNDGISLLNIADSAIEALSNVIIRIRELSEQAANGTYSNAQRSALNNEAQELADEYNRISKTTSFNGMNILDGSIGSGLRLQLGIGIQESIKASVGGAVANGQFGNGVRHNLNGDVLLGDMNGDGILDQVTLSHAVGVSSAKIQLGAGNGTFGNVITFTIAGLTGTSGLALGDLNGDECLDLVFSGYDEDGGKTAILLGNDRGSFSSVSIITTHQTSTQTLALADMNNDNILDLVAAGDSLGNATVFIGYGHGDGTFYGSMEYDANYLQVINSIAIGDINGDGRQDMALAGGGYGVGFSQILLGAANGNLNSGDWFVSNSGPSEVTYLKDLNGDNNLDLIVAGPDNYGSSIIIKLGNGTGSFQDHVTYSEHTSVMLIEDFNSDGILDMLRQEGSSIEVRTGNGDGTFSISHTFSTEAPSSIVSGDLNGDGVLDLVTDSSRIFGQSKDGVGRLLSFSLESKSEARQSMYMLDNTLHNLAKQRGTIGASQSRINIAINNLSSAKENFNAAESRIRDADIASESALLVKTQIIQQAAASVLGQANQQPALALRLLS